MLWNGSNDLKLVIVALNNSMKKRIELASRATAGWLNSAVFGMAGPVKSLARYLGATGERAGECLLEEIIPQGFELSHIFPYSDGESAARPLVKSRYNAELHLAIGMLRIFNAEDNHLEAHSPPQCNFRCEPYIEGAAMLDPYGPLFFVMAAQILPKVSPMLGDMFCNAKSPEEVAKVMDSTFTR
jgi:hypothetical protein